MKKITSFAAACKTLSIDTTLPDVSGLPTIDRKAIIAMYKLTVIARAINDGWKPNWNNSDEYKYWPWFDMKNGFSFFIVAYLYLSSAVGSRLCFVSWEAAEYAGTTFLNLYKDLYVLPKK